MVVFNSYVSLPEGNYGAPPGMFPCLFLSQNNQATFPEQSMGGASARPWDIRGGAVTWRFPEMEVPPVIIQFERGDFPWNLNHHVWATPMAMETPIVHPKWGYSWTHHAGMTIHVIGHPLKNQDIPGYSMNLIGGITETVTYYNPAIYWVGPAAPCHVEKSCNPRILDRNPRKSIKNYSYSDSSQLLAAINN